MQFELYDHGQENAPNAAQQMDYEKKGAFDDLTNISLAFENQMPAQQQPTTVFEPDQIVEVIQPPNQRVSYQDGQNQIN